MFTTIISFILVLSFLIFIHELGHYLAARHVNVKVESFSIGFPPKMIGKKVGDTDYMISWIPLGGYVKLFGQNMDDEDAEDPTNYASKSVLQRFYILVAGPAMNLIFAFICMPIVFMIGTESPKYLKDPPIVSAITENSFSEKIGIKKDDEIVSINGNMVLNWEEFYTKIATVEADHVTIEVNRSGNSKTLTGSSEDLRTMAFGASPKIEPTIGGFTDISPLKKAGLHIGDRITSINGIEINEWADISKTLKKTQPNVPTDQQNLSEEHLQPNILNIEVESQDGTNIVQIIPYFNAARQTFLLGISIEQTKRSNGFIESVEKGTGRLLFLTTATFQFIGKMFRGDGSLDEMGGPIRIGQIIGDAVRTSWSSVLFLMSFISLQLGILNLLPIPVLDGGHIFFLAIEKLKGGPLSQALRERSQMIGYAVLMLFMIAVTYNDVLQLG